MQRIETEPLLNDGNRRLLSINADRDEIYGSTSSTASQRTASPPSPTEDEEGESAFSAPGELTTLQACTFLEDAIKYRSIHHKADAKSLVLYRLYYSKPIQWGLNIVIFVIHILAFLEPPSSLTASSDPRQRHAKIRLPCGATETIEILCLLALLVDLITKTYLKGRRQFVRSKWLWAYAFVIAVSILDWCVSVGGGCDEAIRFRRMLRPFFLMQHSSLMKKTVNCLRRTLPQVFSVLLLLFMHLYFFTLFGMLLFPKETNEFIIHNDTTPEFGKSKDDEREERYFSTLVESFMNLLVLLTTANNPDVMMPAYSVNRLYAVFFMVFLIIGLFCFMNILTAVIYNQFRGYFMNSMQASLFRRRLGIRASFEILRRRRVAFKHSSFDSVGSGVPVHHLRHIVEVGNVMEPYKAAILHELDDNMGGVLNADQFQDVFTILEMDLSKTNRPAMREFSHPFLVILQRICAHQYFTFFGCLIAFFNVICISVELVLEYDHVRSSSHTTLGALNLVFVIYYLIEQVLKVWTLGLWRYTHDRGNIFDGCITIALVVVEIVYVSIYGIPFWAKEQGHKYPVTLWDLVRVINMLIMIRLFRIVTQIRAMMVVVSTLLELVRNLKSFAGILVVIYYSYGLLGMELFKGKIHYSSNYTNTSMFACGTYEQLEYWANNFDDFAASLVVLWNVMVVNNWHVFLAAYTYYTSSWSMLYFIVWWLVSVVICLNLFTALILENFIMRWDRTTQRRQRANSAISEQSYHNQYLSVHEMFRGDLEEPSEEALLVELRQHSDLLFSR